MHAKHGAKVRSKQFNGQIITHNSLIIAQVKCTFVHPSNYPLKFKEPFSLFHLHRKKSIVLKAPRPIEDPVQMKTRKSNCYTSTSANDLRNEIWPSLAWWGHNLLSQCDILRSGADCQHQFYLSIRSFTSEIKPSFLTSHANFTTFSSTADDDLMPVWVAQVL